MSLRLRRGPGWWALLGCQLEGSALLQLTLQGGTWSAESWRQPVPGARAEGSQTPSRVKGAVTSAGLWGRGSAMLFTCRARRVCIGLPRSLPAGPSQAPGDRFHIPAKQPFLQASLTLLWPPYPSGSVRQRSMGQWTGQLWSCPFRRSRPAGQVQSDRALPRPAPHWLFSALGPPVSTARAPPSTHTFGSGESCLV